MISEQLKFTPEDWLRMRTERKMGPVILQMALRLALGIIPDKTLQEVERVLLEQHLKFQFGEEEYKRILAALKEGL